MNIIYARVSTGDQNIGTQKDNLWEYATGDLDIPAGQIDVLEDESTGTNIDRSGYREMMTRVRDGEVDAVIVRTIRRLGRTMREINENVHEMIEDHGSGLYVMNDPIEVDPGSELTSHEQLLLSVISWAAEVEAENIRENTIAGLKAAQEAGKWVGRPPYGFTTGEDGYLQPGEEYADARRAIYASEELGWSDRKIERHTGVPRRTVPSLVDRADLYIDEGDDVSVEELEDVES